MQNRTGKIVIERSWKGTGFDYWIGRRQGLLFQDKARLEVSGILSGDQTNISTRVRQKVQQTKRSDGLLPAYIAIIEFGRPGAEIVWRPAS
jgi:hypothetical protein